MSIVLPRVPSENWLRCVSVYISVLNGRCPSFIPVFFSSVVL